MYTLAYKNFIFSVAVLQIISPQNNLYWEQKSGFKLSFIMFEKSYLIRNNLNL